MRLYLSKALMFATLCTIPATAYSATYRMCSPQIAPWTYVETKEDGSRTLSGPYPELKENLASISGQSIELVILPYARMLQQLKQGSCDFTWTLWSESREEYALRGTTFLLLDFGVMAKPGTPLNSYSDLSGMTVVVPRGVKVSNKFDSDKTITKFEVVDYLQGLKMLQHKRADGIAGTFLTFSFHLNQQRRADVLREKLVLKTLPVTIVYSKLSQHLKTRVVIDNAMAKLVHNGFVKQTINKWFGKDAAHLPQKPLDAIHYNN
ncbi:MAG: transporter substrate-binding domain-containing protein [Pseudomonas marincola]